MRKITFLQSKRLYLERGSCAEDARFFARIDCAVLAADSMIKGKQYSLFLKVTYWWEQSGKNRYVLR